MKNLDPVHITKGLPLEDIKNIIIEETNEPLEEIVETERLELLKNHRYLSPYLRHTACNLLHEAARHVPSGYKLLIVTAYRPVWMQKELYRRREKQLMKAHPLLFLFHHAKWRKLVNRYTSPPGGSSHQYGGAVDVTIVDPQGNRLDMGTLLTDYGEKVHTQNNLITEEQKKNRAVLYEAMTKAGFVNYPLEWWHYSYGDRMWAAYSQRDTCSYGPIIE